jgi:hypothetical protein
MEIKLRDHLFVTDQSVPCWPPDWVWTGGAERATAQGEVGILLDVKTHDAISSVLFLFIEHNGASFIGRLSCASPALCQALVKTLEQHRGKSLSSIGELALDLTGRQRSVYGRA